MKKKKLALLGLAVVAGVSLASCGGGNNKTTSTSATKPGTTVTSTTTNKPVTVPAYETPAKSRGRVDIHVSYSGKQGISLVKGTFYNTVENVNYTEGDLLPTWKALASLVNADIKDASVYGQGSDADTYTAVSTAGYKSETEDGQMIDLFYNTTANINAMGSAQEAVNLLNYLEHMPYFSAWLDANPTMKKTIMVGNAIYYTPYFDGYQDVERMFVMDTNLAKAVLDAANFDAFDTTINGGSNPAANVVQSGTYQPYVNADFNYAADTTVDVLNGTKVEQITIKKTENIIKKQNAKLAAGVTGKELAQDFRAYLDAAYGEYIGAGKLYENYSDIFVSEKAAYNADELIALMRLVKANPGVISGDPNMEIEGLSPRGGANNRVDNMADFMQIWGIQGMTSKKDMLYFDANGNLNDASLTLQTYEGVENLSAIYDEGLIMGDFYMKSDSIGSTYYLNKYFAKTEAGGGYAFMLYDYAASTGASNTKVDGIGTDPAKVAEGFTPATGVRPILPPLAYWGNKAEFNPLTQHLRDLTGKSLLRYSEENRSLKANAWCIPTSSDNIEGACAVMDVLFAKEGNRIQDFGPNDGKYWTLGTVAGVEAPVMSTAIKQMIGSSSTDFWTFMRAYVGSTHGVGHVRSTAIQIQSCNAYAQVGLNNLENAIAYGVVNFNLVDKDPEATSTGYTWDSTVPTAGYTAVDKEEAKKYDSITSFWQSNKCAATPTGWVSVVVAKAGTIGFDSTTVLGKTANTQVDYTYKDVFAEQQDKIDIYLYTMADYLGAIPEYAE